MILVVLTVVVIGLLIAALAVYLFMIGVLLNRTAAGLRDCLQSVRTIASQAEVIGPGITRINTTGGQLLGAMPLLIDGADGVAAKLAPSAATTPVPAAPAVPSGVGAPAASHSGTSATEAIRTGGGYLDTATGVGYLDE